jgi:hypothetical protein
MARFTLRRLFFLLAVVAACLTLYVHSVRRQQTVVSAIVSQGGAVWYDCEIDSQSLSAVAPTRRWLANDWFHRVVVVDLGSGNPVSGLSDEDLQILLRLPALRKLVLRNTTELSPAGITLLSRCSRLEWLYLHRPPITPADLRPLSELERLHHLAVFTTLGDAGLKDLAGFPALVELEVSSDGVTDDGVRQLKSLPGLMRLELAGGYRMSPEVEQEMRSSNPSLAIDDGSFRDQRTMR